MSGFRFIRPANGFRIVVEDAPKSYIESECSGDENIRRYWDAMLERMKMTALVEGQEVREGHWTLVAQGAPKLGVPTLQACFTHDHTTLTIYAALVWQLGEAELDDDEDW